MMGSFAVWVTRRLPVPLVRDTERFGLSFAFIVIGVLSFYVSLVAPAGSDRLGSIVPWWAYYEWMITFVTGGGATMIGMWTGRRRMERFGITLSGVACMTYGVALVTLGLANPHQLISGVLFLILALVKLIRLCVSSAARSNFSR